MVLSEKEIFYLKQELKMARIAQQKMVNSMTRLAELIHHFAGIEGHCDYLAGDGFGFAPFTNTRDIDVHIPIDDLITHAENGVDITKEFILNNLSI